MTRRKKIILYTYQKPGHDISINHTPLKDYSEETGIYYHLAQYLLWPYWIWAFPCLEDYQTELCLSYMEIPQSWVLWNLEVPGAEVKWIYFSRQMDNRLPMHEYFALNQRTIREANDLPLAIVRKPLMPGWTMRTTIGYGNLKVNDLRVRLINVMKGLRMNQRKINDQVLLSMLHDGKLQKEIAEHFHVSPVAVCKRVKRLFPKPETILSEYNLTDKEKSFVIEKAKGKSNTQAVIASKYEVTSMESAKVIGSQLMDKPEVQKALQSIPDIFEKIGRGREYRAKKVGQHMENPDPNVSLKALDMGFKLANDYPAQRNINLNADLNIAPVDISKWKLRD